ncbi:transposable element Tcb2 transposase [Trichonephila clavipes]|nr:transposable element Tcb2 transposase [Trichonephila clavipes]
METGWSSMRVARQLGLLDCVVRRCWDQWIRETRFRTPSKDQSSRIPPHMARDARVQPTASSAAIQAQPRESRFNLSSDDNRFRVWRHHGERLNPVFDLHRHTTPTAGVMVWGAIAYYTRSSLLLIRRTMEAQRYVHDILQQHVLIFKQRLSEAIFQQDNASFAWQVYHKTVSALLVPFLGLSDPQICLQSSIS